MGNRSPISNGILYGMSHSITIDRAGRIVLPADIRRRLNLVPGSRLTLDLVALRIELTPQTEPDPELVVRPGHRTVLCASGTPVDAAAATRAERDAQVGRGHDA